MFYLQILIDRLGSKVSHIQIFNSEFSKIDSIISNRCLLIDRPNDNLNTERQFNNHRKATRNIFEYPNDVQGKNDYDFQDKS